MVTQVYQDAVCVWLQSESLQNEKDESNAECLLLPQRN